MRTGEVRVDVLFGRKCSPWSLESADAANVGMAVRRVHFDTHNHGFR